jgi:hypothetical protein
VVDGMIIVRAPMGRPVWCQWEWLKTLILLPPSDPSRLQAAGGLAGSVVMAPPPRGDTADHGRDGASGTFNPLGHQVAAGNGRVGTVTSNGHGGAARG